MANIEWQKKQENKAQVMMNDLERHYLTGDDAEYDAVVHAMMVYAFNTVREQVNGNWFKFQGQDQLIEAIQNVFNLTGKCESYEAIYDIVGRA